MLHLGLQGDGQLLHGSPLQDEAQSMDPLQAKLQQTGRLVSLLQDFTDFRGHFFSHLDRDFVRFKECFLHFDDFAC